MSERPAELDTSAAMLLGEIRGQLRELIHTTNNAGQKLDALSLRVSKLEAEHNRREGASSVIATILKSPALGWLVGAIITAWAVLTGKVHV
jgi:hypothetical protein